MASQHFRTHASVPTGAKLDHALLSEFGEHPYLQVSFQTVSETANGTTVFSNTQLEFPLAFVRQLVAITEKFETMRPDLEEGDMLFLNEYDLEELRPLAERLED